MTDDELLELCEKSKTSPGSAAIFFEEAREAVPRLIEEKRALAAALRAAKDERRAYSNWILSYDEDRHSLRIIWASKADMLDAALEPVRAWLEET